MKKGIIKNLAVLIMAALLVGCTKEPEIHTEESSITLKSDGSVSAVLMESFDKDYYSEQELVNMVNAEIADYNSTHGDGSIALGKHELKAGIMTLELQFKTCADYSEYMPGELFMGTVAEAQAAGYDFNRSLYKASSSENSIGKKDLLEMGSEKLIVLDGSSAVTVPGKIKYYSQGMTAESGDTVRPENDGLYFIIY